jgi:hypothetical protein
VLAESERTFQEIAQSPPLRASRVMALTAPEWFDLGVAAGTPALAGATAWMAWKVRDQAEQTRRLAEIADRQLETTTVPAARVM